MELRAVYVKQHKGVLSRSTTGQKDPIKEDLQCLPALQVPEPNSVLIKLTLPIKKTIGRSCLFRHSNMHCGSLILMMEKLKLGRMKIHPTLMDKIKRTYSEPRKWMRGKGCVTIQFGCCYNYVVDKKGNLPGILRDEEVDPIPTFFKTVIKRLVRWHVLPKTCIPNSCIVNIYDEGDCIPPHIDHHDFVRPFCTVSFLTEADIVFGSSLKIGEPGEFFGPVKIPLPVRSVLILNGNGADVAKHCVPSVPAKRISITFRKMDDSKLPYRFKPDPDFEGMQPFSYLSSSSPGLQAVVVRQVSNRNPQVQRNQQPKNGKPEAERVTHGKPSEFHVAQSDFPPLGGLPNSRPSIRQYPLRR